MPIPVDLHTFLLSLVLQSFCAAPAHQAAAPATPVRGLSNNTATPFYSAVADAKSHRLDDPTGTPVSCRVFGDAMEEYQTPPSSPVKELFRASPVTPPRQNTDWYRNPLYADTVDYTPTNLSLDTSQGHTPFNMSTAGTSVVYPSAAQTTPLAHTPASVSTQDTQMSKTPSDTYMSKPSLDTHMSRTPLDTRVNRTPTHLSKTALDTYIGKSALGQYVSKTSQERNVIKMPQDTYMSKTPLATYASKTPLDTYVSKSPQDKYMSKTPLDTYLSKTPLDTYASKTPPDTYASKTPLDTLLIDTSAPTLDTSVTCVDTRALDDILQDIEWSSPNTPKRSPLKNGRSIPPRSSSFRHKMSDPSPMMHHKPSRPSDKHQHRHSITSCTQAEVSAQVDSDWISADAPDNTLIKPSKLRSSFRSRRGRSCDKENVPLVPENQSQQAPAYSQPAKKPTELKDTARTTSIQPRKPAVKSRDAGCVNGQSKGVTSPVFEPHETACTGSPPATKGQKRGVQHRTSDLSIGSTTSFKEDQSHHTLHGLSREESLTTQESGGPQKLWLNRKPSLESSDDELRVSALSLSLSVSLSVPVFPSLHHTCGFLLMTSKLSRYRTLSTTHVLLVFVHFSLQGGQAGRVLAASGIDTLW